MISVKNKIIMIAGCSSFLGENIKENLIKRGAYPVCFNTINANFLSLEDTQRVCELHNYDYVINLLTFSGNVAFNQKYPADTFYRTSAMGLNLLRTCNMLEIPKVVSILSSCAISDCGDKILDEYDLHMGPPHPSIESHGYAKRILDIYSRQIRYQYGSNYVTCILQNLFGPKDSTDLSKTKVVMSLIKKYWDAKLNNLPEVINWGTGIAKRELLYVKDAAEGVIQVLEKYNEPTPINISSDFEITIKELAERISNKVEYTGQTVWDASKGEGQLRKKLSTDKMKQYLDIKFTDFDQGLSETINWYIHKNDSI